jgi:hypothetical protein
LFEQVGVLLGTVVVFEEFLDERPGVLADPA